MRDNFGFETLTEAAKMLFRPRSATCMQINCSHDWYKVQMIEAHTDVVNTANYFQKCFCDNVKPFSSHLNMANVDTCIHNCQCIFQERSGCKMIVVTYPMRVY